MAKSSSWEKDLAKEASRSSAREKSRGGGGGNKISIRKRRYTLGEEKLGREMKVVVLDFIYLNTLYKGKFREDKPNIPSCFALSEDGEDMAPHKNVKKPPNEECDGCPFNEWGSGKGRAKACQGRRRLALIHVDDIESAEDVAEAAIATIDLPVTSVQKKGKDNTWGAYVKTLDNEVHRPSYSVVTLMSFDEDEAYPVPTFELEEKIKDQEVVEALKERIEEARKLLMEPFEGTGGKDEDDEDEDDDDRKSRRKSKSKKTKYRRDEEDDDGDDEEDDDDEDDDEDDEDDDEDDEDDEEDDEEDERRGKRSVRKGGSKSGKDGRRSRSSSKSDEESDEDEDEDDDEDDEDEDDEPKSKKRSGSRFSR